MRTKSQWRLPTALNAQLWAVIRPRYGFVTVTSVLTELAMKQFS